MKNRLTAMKAHLLKISKGKFTGRILNSGWRRVPAITKFNVFVQEYNSILEKIGIKLRLPPKIEWELTKMDRCNRYMKHQVIRLNKAKAEGKNELFWHIARLCMSKSVSFRLSAINRVIPHWFYKMAYSEVLRLNRKVSAIINNWETELEYFRVYIPKDSKKVSWRPLGVPTLEWRLALHMWNNMLHLFLEPHISESQHAFMPGRGTLSAWREVISKINKYDYVYETDLVKFFDSVNITYITEKLLKVGMPEHVANYIQAINFSAPKLKNQDKVDETAYRDRINYQRWRENEEKLDPNSSFYDGVNSFIKENGEEVFNIVMEAAGCKTKEEFVMQQHEIHSQYKPTSIGNLHRGAAQGAPTSPLLCIFAGNEFFTTQRDINGNIVDHSVYADDPLFFSMAPFTIKGHPYEGIRPHDSPDKSRWIKYAGKWVNKLKWLGLIMEMDGKTLSSETRLGRSTRIQGTLVELWEWLMYEPGVEKKNYLEDMAKRNLMGFVVSCLYKGYWTNADNTDLNQLEIENILAEPLHPQALCFSPPLLKTGSSTALAMIAEDLKIELTKWGSATKDKFTKVVRRRHLSKRFPPAIEVDSPIPHYDYGKVMELRRKATLHKVRRAKTSFDQNDTD
jgi:hypothetical protein